MHTPAPAPEREGYAADGPVPFRERIGCTVKEACNAAGIKPTTLYGLLNDGSLKSVKIGKRRLILVASLLRLLEGDKAEAA